MAVLSWTEQEQSDVLEFFGLDSFDAEVWVEYAESKSPSVDEGGEMGEAELARRRETQLLGIQSSSMVMAGGIAKTEQSDPLGLNDAHYLQQLRLRESKQPSQAESDEKSQRSLNINSPNFHPRHFLRHVHRDASYAELIRGRAYLAANMQKGNEGLKNLVKQNFDRFVNAKNSVEIVYADMKGRGLANQDHGLSKASSSLSQAFQKAQEVFHPLLARRGQEEQIRMRLKIYEKYNFIFSLGGKFEKYIELGEYQQASYDYRKAKGMLQDINQKSALRTILERTWNGHLQQVLARLREELFKKLSNPVFTYDVHAKMIEYLLELDAHPDPIGFYLSHRKEQLLNKIKRAREQALQELRKVLPDPNPNEAVSKLMNLGKVHDFEAIRKSSLSISHVWRIRQLFFNNLVEIFETFAPSFSSFTSDIFSGRLQQSNSSAALRKSSSGVKSGKDEGNQLAVYIGRLKDLFAEFVREIIESSKMLLAPHPKIEERAIATSVFTLPILAAVQMLFVTADQAAMSDVAMSSLREIVGSLTSALLENLWSVTIADSKILALYESWSMTGLEGIEFSTALLRAFESMHIQVIKTTSGMKKSFKDRIPQSLIEMPPESTERVLEWLCKSIIGFIEKLDELAEPSEATSTTGSMQSLHIHDMGEGYRMLTILTNLLNLRERSLPQIVTVFNESGLGDEVPEDMLADIQSHLNQVDTRVSRLYLGKRQLSLIGIIRESIEAFDWDTPYAGHGIRPFPDRILTELVAIQTEIGDVSPIILRPLMTELVADIFQEYLLAFKELKSMSSNGYFQARLEVDYLAHKLVTVIGAAAETFLDAIDQVIDTLAVEVQKMGSQADLDQVIDAKLMVMEEQSALTYCCFQYT